MIRKTDPRTDDSIVRYHRADGTLIVTRDDETNEHIIKSRGRKSRDTWTRRVPEYRTTVEPGEHLWRRPGNWATHYRLRPRDGPDRTIYNIPESGQSLLVLLADQHAPIADAYHTVETIGTIAHTARVDVDQVALRDTLSSLRRSDMSDEVCEVLCYLRDNPRDAVRDAEKKASSVMAPNVKNCRALPGSGFDPFPVSFLDLNKMVSHPDYGPESVVMSDVHDLLARNNVVPPSPLVSVTVR